ncbi:creatininase family protein [Thioalkalivibrio sp. ALJT]|uniref:creatininase family protein n=1 Tax=Thioalkalivibrio sp. ALJT TaxID=1158146 RepID=UPI0003734251|nr:creatininase family protein [Thioalkalivibrio sp. ALJT]
MDTESLPWWQTLTSREIAARAGRGAVAILPLSAIEQHGPHLPLETDHRIGLGLLGAAHARLGEEPARLILPPMCVATSNEHTGFPGTLTLRPETALDTLRDLGHSVASSGFRRLLLVNSHGGNTAICDLAALELRQQQGLLVAKHHYFLQPLPDDLGIPAREQRHGLHGGQIETAMMLALAPDRVHLDAAANTASLGETLADTLEHLEPEGRVAFAWMARDLNPAGVVGNAGAATEKLGRALVAHYAESLAAAIRDTAGFDLGQLAP